MKTYIVESDIKDWLAEHRDDLFTDILEACESGLETGEEKIAVAKIRSMYGVTIFHLPTKKDILESLKKCETNFVIVEDYEKAARARDCSQSWIDREMIYKENE